jgi:16S rRNA (cytidine1402-2'-O)-methyltransferase
MFLGFLPPKSGARTKALQDLKGIKASLVLLEGPSRLAGLLFDACAVLGSREAAVARELTKIHEEVRRGPLDELAAHYEEDGPPKGEIVVVIGPPTDEPGSAIDVDEALRAALRSGSLKRAPNERGPAGS